MKSLYEQIEETRQKQFEQEELSAMILLQQAEIKAKQEEQDEVLAMLLLKAVGGVTE